jgi:serine/threonine-protein kinase
MIAATGVSVSNLQYVLNRAPECFAPSNTFDVATDIYAAGLTLFRALNLMTDWKGTLLSTFGNVPGVLSKMKAGTLVAGIGFHPRVPHQLRKIVKKACANQPAKRYASAAAFRDALEDLKLARNWERISPESWKCQYKGSSEQLIINPARAAFEVNYTRNSRRKMAFHESGLTQTQATEYVYQLIAETTFGLR